LCLLAVVVVRSQKVGLLDDPRLVAQIVGLERHTARGRDSAGHTPSAHDDVADHIAGLVAALAKRSGYDPMSWVCDGDAARRRAQRGPGLFVNMLIRYVLGQRRYFGERISAPLLPPKVGDVVLDMTPAAPVM
jgi:hypothetical protein